MAEQDKNLLTAREAARYLRVSLATLHRMEKQGELVPYRTIGGHRRYSLAMLEEWLERSRRRGLTRAVEEDEFGRQETLLAETVR